MKTAAERLLTRLGVSRSFSALSDGSKPDSPLHGAEEKAENLWEAWHNNVVNACNSLSP